MCMYQRRWRGLFNGGCLRSEFLCVLKEKISGLVSKKCAIGNKSQNQYRLDFGSCRTLLCIKEGGEGSSAEDVCDLRIFKAGPKCQFEFNCRSCPHNLLARFNPQDLCYYFKFEFAMAQCNMLLWKIKLDSFFVFRQLSIMRKILALDMILV